MNLPSTQAPSSNLSARRRPRSRPLQSLALVGAIIAALPVACTAQPPTTPIAPPPSATPAAPIVAGLPDFTQLVQRVGPAVVNISAEVAPKRETRSRNQMPDEDQIPEFFRRFFGPDFPGQGGGPGQGQGPRQPRGGARSIGSGFLISQDGYVLTNHHVVDGADTVTVKLTDRREFKAKVIGSDEQSDVALLKIDAKGLPFLRSANASLTKAGQWVVAIGSPFGLDHSVTAGIVSAVGRANPYADQRYVPFIQTDVAINQGNSGGPLLNTAGEVVGINSQIFSNSGGYMGVSFAIPIDVAMNSAEQLRAKGKVSRGQLGVVVQAMTLDGAKSLGLPDGSGALISQVVPGGPAEKAGLQPGDVIRSVNGAAVRESSDLPPLIGNMAPGTKAKLGVFRDGKTVEFSVAVNELDASLAGGAGAANPSDRDDGSSSASNAKGNPLSLAVQDVDPAARQRLGLKTGEGVLVRDPGDAGDAGVRPGDVVLSVGRTPVGSAAALNRALAGTRPGQTVMLLIRRGAQTQFIAVQAGEGK
ncbi:DegQ family serine endoprotease [Lysobacter sp. K5869]|uniref:DegQ family serine endoprotease n=1 Tax=Lysobacter sp. K5869 TaxID=2820808 RepID=UPI001C05F41F|nr:DegQ family serine endoprotease [Lysobacter sp. K5869]